MPAFGNRSTKRLNTCHRDLARLFQLVVISMDCSIIEGHRGEERQNRLFKAGKSRVEYPRGKHNRKPSMAVDVAPYIKGAISWNRHHCIYFAGYVMAIANEMGIPIRWGGNWDEDDEIMTDQKFQDLVHFELT